MSERRYFVGERVLVSRDQSGENHEEATVWDFYELLTEGSSTPQVVVDFDDGERVWMVAREPNVRAIEEDQVRDEFDDEDELEELEDEDVAADDDDMPPDDDEAADGWEDGEDE
jgi:hypothetical protein